MKVRVVTPDHPNALLTRSKTADALTEAGFPVKEATLATMATRGGGPPYQRFGSRALYRWGDALLWAKGRLSAPRCSTSEGDVPPTAMRRPNGKAHAIQTFGRAALRRASP